MKTILNLVKSRIRFHKSRSILTVISIALTTMMLMALGSTCIGLFQMERQRVTDMGSNYHAAFKGLTDAQLEQLSHHTDVETVSASELFATIEYDKMNGFLNSNKDIKGKITSGIGNLTEGREAEQENEICGPPAFFKRMGVSPEIGATVTIPFRVNGEGEIIIRDFVITGLVSERDVSKVDVADSRIAYGAAVSTALIDQYIPEGKHSYRTMARVTGEEELNYDQIKQKIADLAADLGLTEKDYSLNTEYLVVMTDPGTEMLGFGIGIALLIALFAGLVIYSIYYVSVITDIQEIGKLKALGASKKQVKRLLLQEGLLLSLIAIPAGLILGYLIPKIGLPILINLMDQAPVSQMKIFSLPVTAAVVGVVLLTLYLSLLKPMRMAAKVSPIEAIRYQESSAAKQGTRKGYLHINLSRLSIANLSRNRKRTLITITTMGLSCVLFLSLAGVMNSMDRTDFARRAISKGDFILKLDASYNDKAYPENNLNSLQSAGLLSPELVNQIQTIPGVTKVEDGDMVMISADLPNELFENGRYTSMEAFSREDLPEIEKELKRGTADYDKMVQENGILFQSDNFMDEYGMKIGDRIPFTVRSGDRTVQLEATITGSITGRDGSFGIPKDLLDRILPGTNTLDRLYIHTDSRAYDEVKTALQSITGSDEHLTLISLDEEMKIADLSINTLKYPCYLILLLIGIIGFMNLINTMITSIVTRKRELGILQAIGLSDRQLVKMLRKEGMFFTAGTLALALVIGNLMGYLVFLYGKATGFMEVQTYHYPIWETLFLTAALVLGQLAITYLISRRIHKESLVDRMRTNE